jgi:integrase
MQVERAVEQTKQGITVKPPKTRHGHRTITLAPVTVEVAGIGQGKVAPAFATVDGKILSPRSISKAWERVTGRLGIKFSFHATRHHHASCLIAAGLMW